MREHIHVPAHDEHIHMPAAGEPSRDAAGVGPMASLCLMTQAQTDELRRILPLLAAE